MQPNRSKTDAFRKPFILAREPVTGSGRGARGRGLSAATARPRETETRVRPKIEALRAAFAEAAASETGAGAAPTGPMPRVQCGTFRWELNKDFVSFSPSALQMLHEVLPEVPTYVPQLLSNVAHYDRLRVTLSLAQALRENTDLDVRARINGPAGPLFVRLRGRRPSASSPWLVGLIEREREPAAV